MSVCVCAFVCVAEYFNLLGTGIETNETDRLFEAKEETQPTLSCLMFRR